MCCVTATPLEESGIHLDIGSAKKMPDRTFQTTVSTFVKGHIKPCMFLLIELVSLILT